MAYLNTDIPELSGFDTGTCLSNLDVLTLRQNRVSESILAILSELADAIIRDAGGDADTVDSILLSLQSVPESEEERDDETTVRRLLAKVSPINRDDIRRMTSYTGLYARLILYRMVEDRMNALSGSNHDGSAVTALPTPVARGRIAYMPSAFADKAYLRLSTYVQNPRVASAASFVDACEEVHNGLCEYCILPLENTQSGKLTAFTRLILRYRLQVIAICDLENGTAENQMTRFALLHAAEEALLPPLPKSKTAGVPLYLELIHATDSPSLTELLVAAEFCGIELNRVDTLPRFDELLSDLNGGTSPVVICVLNTTSGDLTTFCRFLTLEASEDILVGFYTAV